MLLKRVVTVTIESSRRNYEDTLQALYLMSELSFDIFIESQHNRHGLVFKSKELIYKTSKEQWVEDDKKYVQITEVFSYMDLDKNRS